MILTHSFSCIVNFLTGQSQLRLSGFCVSFFSHVKIKLSPFDQSTCTWVISCRTMPCTSWTTSPGSNSSSNQSMENGMEKSLSLDPWTTWRRQTSVAIATITYWLVCDLLVTAMTLFLSFLYLSFPADLSSPPIPGTSPRNSSPLKEDGNVTNNFGTSFSYLPFPCLSESHLQENLPWAITLPPSLHRIPEVAMENPLPTMSLLTWTTISQIFLFWEIVELQAVRRVWFWKPKVSLRTFYKCVVHFKSRIFPSQFRNVWIWLRPQKVAGHEGHAAKTLPWCGS